MDAAKKNRIFHISSLTKYILLTFGVSWCCWIPVALGIFPDSVFYIGAFGPTLSALFLVNVQEGQAGLKKLWQQLTLWRVHAGWYIFSLFVAVPVVLTGIWLDVWMGGQKPVFNDFSELYLVIPVFFFVLLTSVLGEEIGWRGYALPKSLRLMSGVTAGVTLGVIWGMWHLPLFWMGDNFHSSIPFVAFMLQIMAFSIVYTWMFVNTKGSLLLAHLFHAASNTTLGVLPLLPMDNGGRVRPMWLALSLWCLFAGVLIVRFGADLRMVED